MAKDTSSYPPDCLPLDPIENVKAALWQLGYREKERSGVNVSVLTFFDPNHPNSSITFDSDMTHISRDELVSVLEDGGINSDTFFAHYESL